MTLSKNGGINKKIEQARRDGIVIGLKHAYKIIRSETERHVTLEQYTPSAQADLKDDYSYGRKILAEMCGKLRTEINKAQI